ncbi:tetratricopeptide repeat protein [Neolewinella antarctica]|uniref:Tetratricopeptide (TPR) repeat protein n=1 Tax=Neolewinella antarctica TaxID=442734 RepID=A0ABX0XF68_9BACT|nr:hypothetical protein [Neolewinella antarctica]NJC27559.1 tetratricopeptide (TPR) repeat protein [Neolewinella antarctica]
MFVIPPYVRFAIIAVCLIGGIALWVSLGIWYGIFFVLTGLLLLAGYIFLGTIAPAAEAFQAQDIDGAEKLLNLTLKPDWLYGPNRGNYYILRGNIAMSREDLPTAEAWIRKAEQMELGATEGAMVNLQLCQFEYRRKNFNVAKKYLKKVKEAKINIPQFKEQIAMMDQALKQSGQVKAAQRRGGGAQNSGGYGGKRRRPRTR